MSVCLHCGEEIEFFMHATPPHGAVASWWEAANDLRSFCPESDNALHIPVEPLNLTVDTMVVGLQEIATDTE